MKVTKRQSEILDKYYFDISNPAAYAGSEKVFRVLNKKYPNILLNQQSVLG